MTTVQSIVINVDMKLNYHKIMDIIIIRHNLMKSENPQTP